VRSWHGAIPRALAPAGRARHWPRTDRHVTTPTRDPPGRPETVAPTGPVRERPQSWGVPRSMGTVPAGPGTPNSAGPGTPNSTDPATRQGSVRPMVRPIAGPRRCSAQPCRGSAAGGAGSSASRCPGRSATIPGRGGSPEFNPQRWPWSTRRRRGSPHRGNTPRMINRASPGWMICSLRLGGKASGQQPPGEFVGDGHPTDLGPGQ
jgi:hypothetical protein